MLWTRSIAALIRQAIRATASADRRELAARRRSTDVLLTALMAALPSPAHGQEIARPASTTIRDFASWALRPDGLSAAYALREAGGEETLLVVQDLQTGSLINAPIPIPVDVRADNLQPSWSPDGSRIAFFLPAHGIWRLHVWDLTSGTIEMLGERAACVSSNAVGCRFSRIEWSTDGRQVYFLAQPLTVPASTPRPSTTVTAGVAITPTAQGVTVRESRPPSASPASRATFAVYGVPADLVAADVSTRRVVTLLSGAALVNFSISPDGRNVLGIATVGYDQEARQEYRDYFLLPLAFDSFRTFTVSDGARGGHIEPLLRRVPQSLPTGPIAWAPSSDRFAFIENGALASGNVHLFDVSSGIVRNLTGSATIGEPGERPGGSLATGNEESPGPKFNGSRELLWSPEGDGLYALRRAEVGEAWRSRLWWIPLDGIAINLTLGQDRDVGLPLPATLERSARPPVVPTRSSDGSVGFAAVGIGSPLRQIADLPGGLVFGRFGEFSHVRGGSLFVSESFDAPQEAFLFRPSDRTVRRVSSINRESAGWAIATVRRIIWNTPNDAVRFGYLYLPGARRSVRPPPLIVQVYPRWPYRPVLTSHTYVGRPGAFLPPLAELLRSGYAIFKPDLPVAGGGGTCDEVAASVVASIDAIEASGLADTNRSAIIGHSFGGWTVNCVVTRTARFRAAISVAGLSNFLSLSFSPVGQAASYGIGGGQTMIGRSIWEAVDLYWRESPISGARSVDTPLLLIHGDADQSSPLDQALEMYTALSRLGKRVTLVTYDHADHSSVLTHPDFRDRVFRWVEDILGQLDPAGDE